MTWVWIAAGILIVLLVAAFLWSRGRRPGLDDADVELGWDPASTQAGTPATSPRPPRERPPEMSDPEPPEGEAPPDDEQTER